MPRIVKWHHEFDEMFATKVLVLLQIDSYESAGLNTQIIHMLLTKNDSSILHQPPSSFRIRRIIHIGYSISDSSSRITISVLAWWRREFDRVPVSVGLPGGLGGSGPGEP